MHRLGLSQLKQRELADLYFLCSAELTAVGKKQQVYADLLKYNELKPDDYMSLSELAGV